MQTKYLCPCHYRLHLLFIEVGFPRDLRLERQLVSSILVAWTPPDHVPQAQIQSYQVHVDGQLKATVRGNDRTKALLEKVDITKVNNDSAAECNIECRVQVGLHPRSRVDEVCSRQSARCEINLSAR